MATVTLKPSVQSQSTTPLQTDAAVAADFYQKFDDGGFNIFHPFLNGVRIEDAASVFSLFGRVREDRGEATAFRVIKCLYDEFFKRNPLSWYNLDLYVQMANAMEKRSEKFFRYFYDKITQEMNSFIRRNLSACPSEYRPVCNKVDAPGSSWDKINYHYKSGGLGRVAMKILGKVEDLVFPSGPAGVGTEYKTGKIGLVPVAGALAGFKIEDLNLNGKKVAVVIFGDPKKGARIGMQFSNAGKVSVGLLEKRFGAKLQSQWPGSYQHGAKHPLELVMAEGKPAFESVPDRDRHDGYVLFFPDGTFHIADKRRIRVSEITRDPKDDKVLSLTGNGDISDLEAFKNYMKNAGASSIPTPLLTKDGRTEWMRENGNDERRLLVEFGDGTFAVISTICEYSMKNDPDFSRKQCAPGGGATMGINDMLTLVTRIGEPRGGIAAAVYLDTGHYDYATYYTYSGGRRREAIIGHPDNRDEQMCRVFFYQE